MLRWGHQPWRRRRRANGAWIGREDGELTRPFLDFGARQWGRQREHSYDTLSPRRPPNAPTRASPSHPVAHSAETGLRVRACVATRPCLLLRHRLHAPRPFRLLRRARGEARASTVVWRTCSPTRVPRHQNTKPRLLRPPSWLLPFTYAPALGTATQRKSPRTGNMFPGNGGWASTWMNQPPLPDLNIYSFSADVAVPFPFFFLSLGTGRD